MLSQPYFKRFYENGGRINSIIRDGKRPVFRCMDNYQKLILKIVPVNILNLDLINRTIDNHKMALVSNSVVAPLEIGISTTPLCLPDGTLCN
jgi:hypothetical protein